MSWTSSRTAGPGATAAGRRILVVEEGFAVVGLVRYALGRNGGAEVNVVGTSSAAKALVSPDRERRLPSYG